MSKDKDRSLVRRLALMAMAERSPLGGVLTNWKGGISGDTPDLKRLERDGHMVKERMVLRGPGGSRVFGPWLTVTVLKPTQAGLEFRERHRDRVPGPSRDQQFEDTLRGIRGFGR